MRVLEGSGLYGVGVCMNYCTRVTDVFCLVCCVVVSEVLGAANTYLLESCVVSRYHTNSYKEDLTRYVKVGGGRFTRTLLV